MTGENNKMLINRDFFFIHLREEARLHDIPIIKINVINM